MEEKKFEIIYAADKGGLEKTFSIKANSLKHNTGVKFCGVPYDTKEKNVIKDFSGVVGSFVRILIGKKIDEEFVAEDVLTKIEQMVEMEEDDKAVFRDIICNLYINNGNLAVFNVKSMAYIQEQKSNEEKMALFLYDVLMNDELRDVCKKVIQIPDKNIMNQLIFQAIPELKDKNYKLGKYKNFVPYVREYFEKDINYLVSQPELFSKSLKRVLEYYYMFYVTQFAIKLNQFNKAQRDKVEPLYYTLSWEVTSQDRDAYTKGYSYLKNCVEELFSHAVTLELINHNNLNEPMDYIDFYQYCEENNSEELVKELELLRETYKNHINDVVWNDCNERGNETCGNEAFDSVKKLFTNVVYQFRESQRHGPHDKYKNWILYFVQARFGRSRGRNGMNFNITEEDIILFTQIIVGVAGGKILREKLFEEMEHRGLFFDRDSKNKIIELYEKLNLIEKKSDSGDAQYVRANL